MSRTLPKTSILRRSKEEARSLNASARLPSTISGANLTGVAVDERSALTLTAAFSCINAIATDVAYFPLRVMQRRSDGSRVERRDHPADALLRSSPDGETTTMRARQAWIGHTLGFGNGYQEVRRDGLGRPVALDRLDPARTAPRRRAADNRLYYATDGSRSLRPANVLHLAGLGYDGLMGYSPIRLARQAIALGLSAEGFGAALFGNGLNFRGVLKHPGTMSDQAWESLRSRFEAVHSGLENAHRLLLLEEGVEWVQTSMKLEDAQFLALRQFQVVEVCRIYRVPPHKVMDYSQAGSAYRALEEANQDYVNTTLAPWCVQIEQELNLKLLTAEERDEGYYIEHTLAAILRGDMRSRAEFYSRLRDLGVMTPNLIASLENLNPIGPEGDVRLVPAGYQTLDAAARGTEREDANDGD